MAIAGTTGNALLGLLSIKPMSGYDIRQFIPQTIGFFWNESYGQIYPALKQMTVAGLVEKKTERQKGKPDRHVYSLTEAGREQLTQWLALPVATEIRRHELLLKLFFGRHADPGINRAHVQRMLDAELCERKTYAALARTLPIEAAGNPQLPFWLITLNRGHHDTKAAIRWCRETLSELDRLEALTKKKESKP